MSLPPLQSLPSPASLLAAADAVIFDFDGVLVDSEPLHCRTIAETAADFSLPAPTWTDYASTLMGYDDRDAFRALYRRAGLPPPSPDLLSAVVAAKAARFAALAEQGLVPEIPGAADAVRAVAAQKPVALCSGALRTDVLPVLRHLRLENTFAVLVTADDVNASKPDPASYHLAQRRLLALHPALRAFLAVEDTPDGIQSARAASLPVLGLATHATPSDLLAAGASAVAPSLATALR